MVMKIGLDYDGTLRKLPYPFKWFIKHCNPNDILERANLHFIKQLIFQIIVHTPEILNGNLISYLQVRKETLILISGRREKTDKIEKNLGKYLRIKRFYWRGDWQMYEEVWKYRWILFEDIDVFFEDRKLVIDYLRKCKVKVIEI